MPLVPVWTTITSSKHGAPPLAGRFSGCRGWCMIPNLMVIWDRFLINIGAPFSISPVKVRPTPKTAHCIEKFLISELLDGDISELSFESNVIFSQCFVSDVVAARSSVHWTDGLQDRVVKTINGLAKKKWIGLRYKRYRISQQWLVLSGGGWEIAYCRVDNKFMLARFALVEVKDSPGGIYIQAELA
jgi:hypothetical protein